MKLHLASASPENRFTGYGNAYVEVNGRRFDRSLIVMPDRIIEGELPPVAAELTERHFEFIAGLGPEIVLLGTGKTLIFPAPVLTRALAIARIGLEVMDTSAACRTYNILTAEGRSVAAAVLPA